MEEHIVGLIVLIAVTVDALSFFPIIHCNLVVEDLRLFECGEVTLSYLHKAPCNVCRLNETIRQIFVDRILGYMYFKRFEGQPFAILLSPYCDTHR